MDLLTIAFCLVSLVAFALWFENRRLRRNAVGLRRENERLVPLAYKDELTRCGNRRVFDEQSHTLVAHTLRAGESLGFLVVDLNDLKAVNDARGHPVGDRLIRALADALQNSVRPTDHVCRVGGDEFYLLLPACAPEGLRVVVNRIIANLAKTTVIDGATQIDVRVSIGGVCLFVANDRVRIGDLDMGSAFSRSTCEQAERALIQTGDLAMYEAKSRKEAERMPATLR